MQGFSRHQANVVIRMRRFCPAQGGQRRRRAQIDQRPGGRVPDLHRVAVVVEVSHQQWHALPVAQAAQRTKQRLFVARARIVVFLVASGAEPLQIGFSVVTEIPVIGVVGRRFEQPANRADRLPSIQADQRLGRVDANPMAGMFQQVDHQRNVCLRPATAKDNLRREGRVQGVGSVGQTVGGLDQFSSVRQVFRYGTIASQRPERRVHHRLPNAGLLQQPGADRLPRLDLVNAHAVVIQRHVRDDRRADFAQLGDRLRMREVDPAQRKQDRVGGTRRPDLSAAAEIVVVRVALVDQVVAVTVGHRR